MRFPTRLLLIFGVVAAASCHYAASDLIYVPDNPTYVRDVHPFLSDHCLVCHGHPPDRGAPSYFRLDVYEDNDDHSVLGAQTEFGITSDAGGGVALSDIKSKRMPPAAKDGEGVGPKGIQMLENWVANNLPKE